MGHRISAIIPTYQRSGAVAACISSLLQQSRLPDEIVLVDDSPDTSVEELYDDRRRRDPPCALRFIRNQGNPSLTRSRNLGIDNTDGDLVAFFDSDCVVDPDYLDEAVHTLDAHPEAMAVRGLEIDRRPYPVPYRIFRWVFAQPVTGSKHIKIGFPPTFTRYGTRISDVRRSDSIKGSNMVVRRHALETVRFDEQMERYALFEDIDFALSLRRAFPHSILVNPKMMVDHAVDEQGRIPDDDHWMMLFVHKHYLAHKHYRVGPLRQAKLWWSDLGYVVMRSQRSPRRFRELWGRYRRVRELMRRHEKDLRAGRLEPLNHHYSWMPGPPRPDSPHPTPPKRS